MAGGAWGRLIDAGPECSKHRGGGGSKQALVLELHAAVIASRSDEPRRGGVRLWWMAMPAVPIYFFGVPASAFFAASFFSFLPAFLASSLLTEVSALVGPPLAVVAATAAGSA